MPWVVLGEGVSPPKRQLFIRPGTPQIRKSCRPNQALANASRRDEYGLFNDGPDGDEGTAFARWLAGEPVVEREGDTLLVRDKARRLEENRERERAKSAGWDSDEDDNEPTETYVQQEAVSLELFEPAPEATENATDAGAQEDGTKEHPVDVDVAKEEVDEHEQEAEDGDPDPGFWD
ncbi:hypothetical protein FRC12_021902 [Ceratobasidium sp. 428]|nr:hypothetical protein FRC12_021902 [Ceratobasidium sp. 428]